MSGPAKTKASYRRRASWVLADLGRAAETLRAHGEILVAGPWLKVLANVLSSAPEGAVGSRKDSDAPQRWELSYETLAVAGTRCGVEATEDEIECQVEETLDWRSRESQRLKRPHHIMMTPDKIAELLGITDEIRREAGAWNLGSVGGSPEQRLEARRQRQRIRDEESRRARGVKPRAEVSQEVEALWVLDHVRQAGGNFGAVTLPPQAAIFGIGVGCSASPVMVSRLM